LGGFLVWGSVGRGAAGGLDESGDENSGGEDFLEVGPGVVLEEDVVAEEVGEGGLGFAVRDGGGSGGGGSVWLWIGGSKRRKRRERRTPRPNGCGRAMNYYFFFHKITKTSSSAKHYNARSIF